MRRFSLLAFVFVVFVARVSQGLAADPPPPAATLDAFDRWVIAADFTSDGAMLATAGGESLLYRAGDVVVWKADGTRVGDLPGHPTAVWAVKISRDGKLAATAGYDGLVKLWDFPARTLKTDLKKHKGWVRSLDFSPDGTKLATAGEDGTVVMWKTADGSELKTIAAHTGPVMTTEFSPDGGTLATGGGDKLVKLWDAANGTEKAKLEGHGDAVWSVAFTPDGGTLATAAADRTVKLWNVADKKERATLKGHKDWVTTVAFSPDGSRLASGSLDGAIKLWDVKAAGEQEGPAAEKSSVWCVAFAPENKQMVVGTHAGAKLVAVPAAKLLPPPPTTPAPTPPKPAAPPAPASAVGAALVPTAFTSMAGATGAIAKDGVITVTGPLAKDTYTIKAVVPEGVTAKAIRLDVLPDPSLPSQGPGRAGNGNFVVSTFSLMFGPPGKADTPTPVKFASAKADYEQPNFTVAGAIDDKPATGWAISGGTGKEHQATFEMPADVKLPPGVPLTITIDQQYADGQHTLGKFRLSLVPTEAAKP
jgi:tricorn protease-like protein